MKDSTQNSPLESGIDLEVDNNENASTNPFDNAVVETDFYDEESSFAQVERFIGFVI